ncbi:MAG: hypothetical protein IKB51_06690 [Clostridia bacterium]|nr:hypothetical protein [Clostridia bacterium]
MIIKPGIEQLSDNGKYNRYVLCIAAAKCARKVTDEYVEQYAKAEMMVANKETDKPISAIIQKELRDDKAVKTAIKRLANHEYEIDDESIHAPGKNVR